jgi:hypothetical protein
MMKGISPVKNFLLKAQACVAPYRYIIEEANHENISIDMLHPENPGDFREAIPMTSTLRQAIGVLVSELNDFSFLIKLV